MTDPMKQPPPFIAPAASPETLAQGAAALIAAFRNDPAGAGFNEEARRIAESMVDYCEGGTLVNGKKLLPQATLIDKADGKVKYNAKLDVLSDGLETADLTASVMAAGALAARNNVTLDKVPVNEEFLELARSFVGPVKERGICPNPR